MSTIKRISLIILVMYISACKESTPALVSEYKIQHQEAQGEDVYLEVGIGKRLDSLTLVRLSEQIKLEQTNSGQVKIRYYLPRDISVSAGYYAECFYPTDANIKKRLPTDEQGDSFELNIFGASAKIAMDLLRFNPPNVASKTIIGKFVDNTPSSYVLFHDKREDPSLVYIMQFLKNGTAGQKIVTKPIKLEGTAIKLLTGTSGEYFELQDSILTKYDSGENNSLPYYSIKSGI